MGRAYADWAARRRVSMGFVMGIAFVILSQPTIRFLAIGGGIALLGLLLRSLAAGYLEKGRTLATSGPYRYTRNPLYLGSFFIGLGFAIAARSWVLGLAFVGFFILIYWPVMRREEMELQGRFGVTYGLYAKSVPLFFPWLAVRSGTWRAPFRTEKFLWQRYRKNREYEAAFGYLLALVFLAVKLQLR